jgi:tetratricopeptide (TPR) repeat protein
MNSPTTPIDTVTGSARVEYQQNRAAGVRLNPPTYLRFILLSIFLGFLVCFPFLVLPTKGEETNSLQTLPGSAMCHSLPNPQELAMEYERAGRKREAAALYEDMARTNAAARKVLSHRLVMIYTETGETNKALTWAHEVMRDNPDPQAYLAAVQTRLGQCKEARKILEHEIAANTNATRAVTLRWQLAEDCEKMGDSTKARKLLNEAAVAAKGTPMEPAAQKRLVALKQNAK